MVSILAHHPHSISQMSLCLASISFGFFKSMHKATLCYSLYSSLSPCHVCLFGKDFSVPCRVAVTRLLSPYAWAASVAKDRNISSNLDSGGKLHGDIPAFLLICILVLFWFFIIYLISSILTPFLWLFITHPTIPALKRRAQS